MFLSICKWFRGYVTILLYGNSPERFMNLCRKRNILLWNLHTCQGYCVCNISIQGFRMLRPIARKTKTRPVIQKKAGFPFFIRRYRNRAGFLVGMILCLFFLYYSSLFIWKITAEGEYTHTEEEIIKFLKTNHISVGTKISDIDAAKAEDELRKHFHDIGWVSIEITGTRLYVHIAETNMPIENKQAAQAECDLVASHDGIVKHMITRKGTPQVEENEEVKKGDVLVSGLVQVIGDSGEVVGESTVSADADILLETNYEYQDYFPMEYEEQEYTGSIKTAYGISVFGYTFFMENPWKTIANFEKYDIIMTENDVHLGKNFILPLSMLKKQWREYRGIPKVYTKEEAQAEAEKHLSRYLNVLKEREVEVLSTQLSFSITQQAAETGKKAKQQSVSMAAVSGTLCVLEPQREQRSIRISSAAEHIGQQDTNLEDLE